MEMVVTMGALLADVPHSRPVSVAANSQDPTLVEKLNLSASRYEGPTGITGVLHRICADSGLPSVSFWASVPHYLPAVPSAPATLALLQNLSVLLGVEIETGDLEEGAVSYRDQVSVAVSQDSDLSSYVQMLEERFDSQVEGDARSLPTGDELGQCAALSADGKWFAFVRNLATPRYDFELVDRSLAAERSGDAAQALDALADDRVAMFQEPRRICALIQQHWADHDAARFAELRPGRGARSSRPPT